MKMRYFLGTVALAAVLGAASAVSAGPECEADTLPAGPDCNAVYEEALLSCSLEGGPGQQACRIAARAAYSACMNEVACTGA